MQRSNFNPRMNPFPTHHQIHQFPSQIPQNPPTINPYKPHYIPQFQSSNHPFNPQIPPSNHPSSSSLDYETQLRDEVIYLHSLWHRGPPPTLNRPSQTPHFLKPSNSTHYKKTRKKFKTFEKTHLISDKEWPVESLPKCPSPSGSSWPEFKPHSALVSRPATAEEREKVLGLKIHLKGLDSCSGLFHREGDNESDDDMEEEEDDDGDDVEEFEFFMKVFEEDSELRGYYEKNCENGEFYCLVCGVIGKKLRRKYKNCVALVQHSITISNTKKRNAHRAFGHVICKVLGWDVNRLPSVPSTVEGEVNNHADGWKDNCAVVEREEDFANTSHSEAGTKVKPDAIQMENDNALDAACLASELTESAVATTCL
ncbi:hypothetical protein BVRB_4g085660 isoform B [Beta vulgaris subsp. vulgaris]|nr:hypothetical protein BVRB_4g085660 isoform B [Beta vulgaris subsp. vulgaris]